jgi:hypothetical protein
MKILLVDVKKAHLNGVVPQDVYAYVQLPDGRIWRLLRWLYGMRPAANAWEADFTEKLASIGFKRGLAAPTVYYNMVTSCRCVVHGDDFTFLGTDVDIKEVICAMKRWYEIKVRGILGGEDGDDEEVTILNRRLSWRGNVIEYEADCKHAQVLVEEMGLEASSNGLESPTEREEVEEGADREDDGGELLGPEEARKFRGLAARANYLGQDRADLQFAAKEVCRKMSSPKDTDWRKLKRLARYLITYPRVIWRFTDDEHTGNEVIDVFSDSDWAGDKRTRKSTSGGVVAIAGGAIKSWSSTQGTIALSSGEAEYYALVKAVAEGLGIQALALDLGYTMKLRVWVDSTAAKAVVSRLGLGKVRHLEVKYLWAQEALRKGRFEVRKIAGTANPADLLTKPLSAGEMSRGLEKVSGFLVRKSSTATPRSARTPWADIEDDDAM